MHWYPTTRTFFASRKVGEAAALIATGAEDSTVRLWDLREGRGATGSPSVAMCLCRCFDGEAVASVVFAPGDGNRLYCSAGAKVCLCRKGATVWFRIRLSSSARDNTNPYEYGENTFHTWGLLANKTTDDVAAVVPAAFVSAYK